MDLKKTSGDLGIKYFRFFGDIWIAFVIFLGFANLFGGKFDVGFWQLLTAVYFVLYRVEEGLNKKLLMDSKKLLDAYNQATEMVKNLIVEGTKNYMLMSKEKPKVKDKKLLN